MFNPIPPQSNQPAPTPADEPIGDEPDNALDAAEPSDSDLEMPLLHRPSPWPALVRWSRMCRVLAFVSLICFGWNAASNIYQLLQGEPQFPPFMPQRVTPAGYLFYAFLNTVFAIASCISLLGFAELLYLLMSIDATARHRRDRAPPPAPPPAPPDAENA